MLSGEKLKIFIMEISKSFVLLLEQDEKINYNFPLDLDINHHICKWISLVAHDFFQVKFLCIETFTSKIEETFFHI